MAASVSQRLHAAYKQSGMTYTELAARAELPIWIVRDVLKGKALKQERVDALAKVMGIEAPQVTSTPAGNGAAPPQARKQRRPRAVDQQPHDAADPGLTNLIIEATRFRPEHRYLAFMLLQTLRRNLP